MQVPCIVVFDGKRTENKELLIQEYNKQLVELGNRVSLKKDIDYGIRDVFENMDDLLINLNKTNLFLISEILKSYRVPKSFFTPEVGKFLTTVKTKFQLVDRFRYEGFVVRDVLDSGHTIATNMSNQQLANMELMNYKTLAVYLNIHETYFDGIPEDHEYLGPDTIPEIVTEILAELKESFYDFGRGAVSLLADVEIQINSKDNSIIAGFIRDE